MKRILVSILIFGVAKVCFAQTHRIDSVRQILPSQKAHAEVKSLIALAKEYYFYWPHSDSALKFANLAYKKASAMNYNGGRAEALLIHAGVEGRLLGHPAETERLARFSIEILKNEKDLKPLSMAFYYLGIGLTIQGKYQEAAEPFQQAKKLALRINDKFSLGWAEQGFGFLYFKSAEYWKSFPYLNESQRIGREIGDSVLTTLSLALIARSFSLVGDPRRALDYYHQAFQYSMPFIRLWSHHEDMAYAHLQLKQYDSAQYYQQLATYNLQTQTTDPKVRKKFAAYAIGYSVAIQLAKKQYDTVLMQLLPVVQQLRQTKDVVPYMHALLMVGKAYEAKGEHTKSLKYTRELYEKAHAVRNKRYLKDANELLASIFGHLKRGDSAYHYYRHFATLKDSMETAQYAGRTALYLAAFEAKSKIRLLQKDKEISEQQLVLNRKELQKQAQFKNGLVAGFILLLAVSLLIFYIIGLKRKNEKLHYEHEQSALKQKATELEMQALRAQMNPHFIFNCLSAIDNLIQTNQTDNATTYLSRFAKLIRSVLDSSKNNLVPFEKDFETLKLYLEMEQFRCNNKFIYKLHAEDELLHGDYKVPPLIIQPFIENAIHHGLLNKQEGNRQLNVEAQLKDEHIVYSIIDNGIGRKKAVTLRQMNKPDWQSYGIEITKERIQLYNKNSITTDLVITDLEEGGMPAGTKAIVRINCFE